MECKRGFKGDLCIGVFTSYFKIVQSVPILDTDKVWLHQGEISQPIMKLLLIDFIYLGICLSTSVVDTDNDWYKS